MQRNTDAISELSTAQILPYRHPSGAAPDHGFNSRPRSSPSANRERQRHPCHQGDVAPHCRTPDMPETLDQIAQFLSSGSAGSQVS